MICFSYLKLFVFLPSESVTHALPLVSDFGSIMLQIQSNNLFPCLLGFGILGRICSPPSSPSLSPLLSFQQKFILHFSSDCHLRKEDPLTAALLYSVQHGALLPYPSLAFTHTAGSAPAPSHSISRPWRNEKWLPVLETNKSKVQPRLPTACIGAFVARDLFHVCSESGHPTSLSMCSLFLQLHLSPQSSTWPDLSFLHHSPRYPQHGVCGTLQWRFQGKKEGSIACKKKKKKVNG